MPAVDIPVLPSHHLPLRNEFICCVRAHHKERICSGIGEGLRGRVLSCKQCPWPTHTCTEYGRRRSLAPNPPPFHTQAIIMLVTIPVILFRFTRHCHYRCAHGPCSPMLPLPALMPPCAQSHAPIHPCRFQASNKVPLEFAAQAPQVCLRMDGWSLHGF